MTDRDEQFNVLERNRGLLTIWGVTLSSVLGLGLAIENVRAGGRPEAGVAFGNLTLLVSSLYALHLISVVAIVRRSTAAQRWTTRLSWILISGAIATAAWNANAAHPASPVWIAVLLLLGVVLPTATRIRGHLEGRRDQFEPTAETLERKDRNWHPPEPRCSLFLGRLRERDELTELVVSGLRPVIVVAGPGGTGKSELVRRVVERQAVRAAFDGLRWLRVKGTEFVSGAVATASPRVLTVDIVRELAEGLSCDDQGALAERLSRQRWLIVIDNAEALEDEDHLFEALGEVVGGSRIVVTSRNTRTAPFIELFPPDGPLPGLSRLESEELLRHEARSRKGQYAALLARADQAEMDKIYRLTSGAPLALHLVAGACSRSRLHDVLADLSAGAPRAFYDFMYRREWARLRYGRDVLDYLAHCVDEAVPLQLLEATGVAAGHARQEVVELRDRSLVETTETGCLDLHPLTRNFIRALEDGPEFSARWRRNGGIARQAGIAYLIESLSGQRWGAGATRPLGGMGNYLAWLAEGAHEDAPRVLLATIHLSRYLGDEGRWDLFPQSEECGKKAVAVLAGPYPRGMTLMRALYLAASAYGLMREQKGIAPIRQALADAMSIFEELEDEAGLALSHRHLGHALLQIPEAPRPPDEAGLELEQALTIVARARSRSHFPAPGTGLALAIAELRQLGVFDALTVDYRAYANDWDPHEAMTRNLLGIFFFETGRTDEAIAQLTRSIELYRTAQHGSVGIEANPMTVLAQCYERNGDLSRAEGILGEALEVTRRHARAVLEARVRMGLARVLTTAGRPSEALDNAAAAQQLFERLKRTRQANAAAVLVSELRNNEEHAGRAATAEPRSDQT